MRALRRQVFAEEPNCGICHEPMDYSAKWPSAAYPSIDHIVPEHLGGQTVRENLQAAHHGCNSRKNMSLVHVDMFTLTRMAVRLAGAA